MVVDKKLLLTVLVGQYGVLLSSGVSGDGKNSSYNLAGGLSLGLLPWLTEIVILLMVNLEAKVLLLFVFACSKPLDDKWELVN